MGFMAPSSTYIDKLQLAPEDPSRALRKAVSRACAAFHRESVTINGERREVWDLSQPRAEALALVIDAGADVLGLEAALDIHQRTRDAAELELARLWALLDDPRVNARGGPAFNVCTDFSDPTSLTLYQRPALKASDRQGRAEGRNVKGYADLASKATGGPCVHLEVIAKGQRECLRVFGVEHTWDLRLLVVREYELADRIRAELGFAAVSDRLKAKLGDELEATADAQVRLRAAGNFDELAAAMTPAEARRLAHLGGVKLRAGDLEHLESPLPRAPLHYAQRPYWPQSGRTPDLERGTRLPRIVRGSYGLSFVPSGPLPGFVRTEGTVRVGCKPTPRLELLNGGDAIAQLARTLVA